MHNKFLISILVLLAGLTSVGLADPYKIIIVTGKAESEHGYTEFLQEIYKGNVDVQIDADRYDEDLSDKKKLEIEAADLIIVSRDLSGTDYNADAGFWNALAVPIINHNIKLVRSDDHKYWDWLAGNDISTGAFTHLAVAYAGDEIFAGVDTSSGFVEIFTSGKEIDHSNQGSAGSGTVVATLNGTVVIARWFGGETLYYDESDYAPGAARVFFALPENTYEFFDEATDQAKLMLENAILSLLPIEHPAGDIDLDGDVDFHDFAAFANCWKNAGFAPDSACGLADLTGDAVIAADDVVLLTDTWLQGVDITVPEPNIMNWQVEPVTTSTSSIYMEASITTDTQNGIVYYFQCTSGNGPDSGWQYSNVFETNGLTMGTQYTYRAKARDTSGNLNETEWSIPVTTCTYKIFYEIADASAAVALAPDLFIVGGDEKNKLRVYDINNPGSAAIADAPIGDFLNIDLNHTEIDIEGATWFNGRIFWITSHGRNRFGQYWFSRSQFFATTVTLEAGVLNVTVDGNYTNLIDDLIAYDSIYNLGLAEAIGVADGRIDPNKIPELAPKDEGLNIEGLCAADGSSMLIGFRNPRPKSEGKKLGLIIRLNNPEAVVLRGEAPDFSPPLGLDLDGYGIRSMEYSPTLGQYLVMAGSKKAGSERPVQVLYKYHMATETLTRLADFPYITPEAMFQFPASNKIHLLSDDGAILIDTPDGLIQNKYLPKEQRTFRAHQITP
ncbi:MAG: DUF3616 domain-containing protein [Sedimentisphaerales bacterium]|nr:DUF3616 domain-containing protein [Sedimentisphaerales bacterium]